MAVSVFSSRCDFTNCPSGPFTNSVPPFSPGTGMSEPSAEPTPTVKICMLPATRLASAMASAERSSPSVKITSTRLSLSPLPKAFTAARIASAMSVPPSGMIFVSSSFSESSTAV